MLLLTHRSLAATSHHILLLVPGSTSSSHFHLQHLPLTIGRVELLLLHLFLHRLTCFILLHVEHFVDVRQEVSIVVVGALPIDALSKLLDRAALLQVQIALSHKSKHLHTHFVLLPEAALVHVDQSLKFLGKWV